jgi:uncharacterized protein YndB with AHSA1/START domain
VTVNVSQERAFELFTHGFNEWWPIDSHHIGEAENPVGIIEPREGGRWYERGDGGVECDWGRVLVWEPPRRVVFAWHLDPDWRFDPDPERATEVEVLFEPEGAGATRVELEHRGFERLGDRADEVRTSVGSEGGWPGLMSTFAERAAA